MASSSETNILDLLLKAKTLSVKLGVNDILDWIEFELNGYESNESLPDYRILRNIPIEAKNHFGVWVPCPVDQLNSLNETTNVLYDTITTFYVTHPAQTIVEFLKREQLLRFKHPHLMSKFLFNEIFKRNIETSWVIDKSLLSNILPKIKSKILDWTLELERKGIYGNDLMLLTEEKKEAREMTINNTNNFHGNVINSGAIGAGSSDDINQNNNIVIDNFEILDQKLRDFGISDDDIANLKNFIKESPKPTSSANFGEKIGGWLGGVVGKAFSGTLKIAGTQASSLITSAICAFYGIE